jgi:hypothetical protein
MPSLDSGAADHLADAKRKSHGAYGGAKVPNLLVAHDLLPFSMIVSVTRAHSTDGPGQPIRRMQ